jgi:TonB-linked SusC/RagA family outer membrane protein
MPSTFYRLLKVILLSLLPVFAFSQDNIFSGKIISPSGHPVEGASVRNLRTGEGTSSDAGGMFSIRGNPGDSVEFSHVEFQTRVMAFSIATDFRVEMLPKENSLESVVVVGYGTQRRRDLTGAVGSVNTSELSSLPVPDIGAALQGRASGVQIVSSGTPGANVTIRVRGTGTINNSDPLLVVDGVPTDLPLNAISPDDIASIEILKDASAAAIYGARGANGVVLISTKRGIAGKNSLELKAYGGLQSRTNEIEMLNASQFASLHNEMMANNGQPQNPEYANPHSLGEGTDWLAAMFRNGAPMQSYNLSFSGGSGKSSYYVSGNVFNQDGIVIHTNYKRYTVQFNYQSEVFDWLKFGNNISFSHDVKSQGSYDIRNAMLALPTQKIKNDDGTWAGPEGHAAWYGDVANPVGKATENQETTRGYNILGNIYAELKLFEGLKFKTTGGVQASFWDNKNWAPAYDWKPIPQEMSYLYRGFNKSLTWLWDNYFTYDKNFSGAHRLNFMAGTSAQTNRYDYMNGSVQQFASDRTRELNNGTLLPTVGGSASEWALFSLMARANYSYNDKFLATVTVRRDGSSRFGKNNRFGTFPSASLAWRISEEEFIRGLEGIDDLKLRVGYGVTGNQNIGNYSFASVFKTVQYNFNGQAVTAIVPDMIPNPSIRWEKIEQFNLGVDATLLNRRINLTADFYIKNTNDMLVPMSVPISTGYSDINVPYVNMGKIQNKGVELGIHSVNLDGNVGWTSSFNISFNQNRILRLNDTIPMYTGSIGLNQNLSIQHPGGYPVNEFYGFVTNGIFQNQAEVDAYAVQVPGNDPYNRTSPGDIKFKDLNNDGVINDDDRTFLGSPNPSVIFALNNTFTFKGFDLSVFLQGVAGNKIFNANRIYTEGMAVAYNQTKEVLKRWSGEGTSNTMPRAVYNDPNKNTRVSDRYIEDGSYLRVKNVTLGYTLPATRTGVLQSMRIYLSAVNLFTFTKYSGFDPEVGINGIDLNVYPVTKTISAGIQLTF